MDYGPTGRRQEGSDCGQDVDLQKRFKSIKFIFRPNIVITASGMPVLPLLLPLWVVTLPSALFFLYSTAFYSTCLLK